jgi:hypothetical protein
VCGCLGGGGPCGDVLAFLGGVCGGLGGACGDGLDGVGDCAGAVCGTVCGSDACAQLEVRALNSR